MNRVIFIENYLFIIIILFMLLHFKSKWFRQESYVGRYLLTILSDAILIKYYHDNLLKLYLNGY